MPRDTWAIRRRDRKISRAGRTRYKERATSKGPSELNGRGEPPPERSDYSTIGKRASLLDNRHADPI
ncbi:MAG: hypothetical protein QGG09_03110, partial [Pirellulaceae bacterium]|nr:hypothetical protein [Pirellulaceae bacterium]